MDYPKNPENPENSPKITTIKVDKGSTKKYLEQIKGLRDYNSYDQTVRMLVDVYSPFLNPKVDRALKKVAQRLVVQRQIPEATEAEVVEFALKFLMVNMLSPEPLETKEKKPILKPEGEEPKHKPESTESEPESLSLDEDKLKGGEEIAGGEIKRGKEREEG